MLRVLLKKFQISKWPDGGATGKVRGSDHLVNISVHTSFNLTSSLGAKVPVKKTKNEQGGIIAQAGKKSQS